MKPPETPSRRSLLQLGICGLTGACLSGLENLLLPMQAAERPEAGPGKRTADAVLFLNLAGGPSHLDTLDMKPDAPSETRGEFRSIQTKLPGFSICEHLPKLAAVADQCAIIRGISHTAGAHPQGQSYIATGNRPSPAVVYPSLGSVISKELSSPADLPPYVAVPQTEWNAGYMGDAFAPFKTNAVPKPGKPFSVRGISLPKGLTLDKVQRREQLRSELDRTFRELEADDQLVAALSTFGKQAYSMITSRQTRQAFDTSLESPAVRKIFSDNDVSQGMLLGMRLIENGASFVTVTQTGWDTHTDNFSGHRRLMPVLDAGLSEALLALRTKGLLERTLVVAMGEFGRTPKINANVGRDHFPRVGWCVMAGGGVKPGQLLGNSNSAGDSPDDKTDIKPDDLAATILHALGIDHHRQYYTSTGRPVSLVAHGRVLKSLF